MKQRRAESDKVRNTDTIAVSLPHEDAQALRSLAERESRTVSSMVLAMIRAEVAKDSK